ncbi:MAG: DPP IV N-terminal domain-containing protein [Saprospiraceae bacterium]|nr:DPP IV N-terminal domain-containing protein [Saprospiraceae bacterium]
MKQFLTALIVCFLFHAQTQSLPNITGWLDDNNYLESRMDNMVTGTYKVNAASGQSTPYIAPQTIKLPDSLRSYSWGISPEGHYLLKKQNDLFLFDGTLRALTSDALEEKVPAFSPDGKSIAYVKGGNLWVVSLQKNLHQQLTTDGNEDVYNGYASWVYYEEILGRSSRYRAFWWSPDGSRIAYLHSDDNPVPKFPVYRSEGVHGSLEMEHYPKSGDPNPLVHMEIVDLSTGSITKIEEDATADMYTAWPFWTPDSKQLIFQELNRDQTHLSFYSYDIQQKSKTFLFDEKYPTWVEFHEDIWFLKDNSFLMIHPLDGWWNIYKYDQQSKQVRQLTKYKWRINDIVEVDESKNRILFTGTGDFALNKQLYSIKLDGSSLKQLSQGEGTHQASLSPGGTYFIDSWSSLQSPKAMYVATTEGKKLRDIGSSPDPNKIARLKTEYFTVPSGDGFDLPVVWTLPADFEEGKAAGKVYPVIFSIYGGPDAGTLRNAYRDNTQNKLLNQGVITLSTDHRASGKFGKKGLDFMHRNLGKWEIHDYSKVAEWLKTLPYIDTTHIAIEGGSYGGYMTALALTKAPNLFTHGMSFAPVIDWRLYDNVYTERYMDTPQDNPEGYEAGDVLNYTDQLKGKLFIVHGSADDNVHMQNTFHLIEKLQLTGKQFEMMVYPNVRHGWGGARKTHLNNLENDWWNRQNFAAKKPAPKS